MKKTRSFRWLLRASVFCVALPLAMLLIVNTIYSVRAFNLRIADSNQRTVDACVWQIEDKLARVDDTMNAIEATNADFQALSKGVGQLQAHLSSQALHGQTKPIMSAYPALGAVFIYSHTSGAERDMFAETFSYPQKLEIREYIRTAVRENSFSSRMGWRWARIGDAAYLLRFYGGRSTYLVALAPLDKLMATAEWEPGREAVASFVTLDNEPLTQREFIESHRIALRGGYRGYFLSGSPERYMIIGRQMSNADCILVFFGERGRLFGGPGASPADPAGALAAGGAVHAAAAAVAAGPAHRRSGGADEGHHGAHSGRRLGGPGGYRWAGAGVSRDGRDLQHHDGPDQRFEN